MPEPSDEPIVVEFPVRGEGWMAVTSPGDRIPSHGTDLLGQRFAFDLLRVDDRKRLSVYPGPAWRALLIGHRTRDCYAWGEPIHAPLDAEVVTAQDGMDEPAWLHPARDLSRAIWNGLTFRPSRLPRILGNHVVIRAGDVYAAFAHLAPGSVAVSAGQRLSTGDLIGRVGHTGNSTSAHLHFQLMDSPDPLQAKGLPCAFARYELKTPGGWVEVTNGLPRKGERIRSVEAVR